VFDFLSGPRKHASQAEMFRVLELQMNKKLVWTQQEIAVLQLLKANYGVVGRELVRWMVANREVAAQVYQDVRERVKKDFDANDDERYWTAGNSAIVAITILLGSKYANLIDIPVGPVINVLKTMTSNARSIIYGSKRTAEDVLNAYTREFYGKFVVVKSIDGTLRSSLGEDGNIDQSLTRSDVAGRVEHNVTPGHVDYFIEEQLLKAHCVSMSYGYSDFKKQMESMANYKVNYVKKDMLARTRGPSMRVNAIKVSRPLGLDEQEA